MAQRWGEASTPEPFTGLLVESTLATSSSGGGLFDGRPVTLTGVGGAFVFLAHLGNEPATAIATAVPASWANRYNHQQFSVGVTRKNSLLLCISLRPLTLRSDG